MLIEGNIIIYAAQTGYGDLRRFIAQHAPAVSAVSYVEVLGQHRLTEQEQQYFRIAGLPVLNPSETGQQDDSEQGPLEGLLAILHTSSILRALGLARQERPPFQRSNVSTF